MTRYAVYGRTAPDRPWTTSCGNLTPKDAILTAVRLELDPEGWPETAVLEEPFRPLGYRGNGRDRHARVDLP